MRRLRIHERSRFIARLPGIRLGKARNETRLPRPLGARWSGFFLPRSSSLQARRAQAPLPSGDFTAPRSEEPTARSIQLTWRWRSLQSGRYADEGRRVRHLRTGDGASVGSARVGAGSGWALALPGRIDPVRPADGPGSRTWSATSSKACERSVWGMSRIAGRRPDRAAGTSLQTGPSNRVSL
jgi:hypothetical protein